jgi:hypothetical protein
MQAIWNQLRKPILLAGDGLSIVSAGIEVKCNRGSRNMMHLDENMKENVDLVTRRRGRSARLLATNGRPGTTLETHH